MGKNSSGGEAGKGGRRSQAQAVEAVPSRMGRPKLFSENLVKLDASIPVELRDAIAAEADRSGRKRSAVVREWLEAGRRALGQ